MLATIPVTLAHDSVDLLDDGEITLRDAVRYVSGADVPPADLAIIDQSVDDLGTNDTIIFSLPAGKDKITLGLDEQGSRIPILQGSIGDLNIRESVTIDAEGQNIIVDASGTDPTPDSDPLDSNTLDDGDGSSVFLIEAPIFGARSIDVVMRGFTITGGDVSGDGGGMHVTSDNGRLASLELHQMVIDSNHATGDGGGLRASFGDNNGLIIDSSTISNNRARTIGGGIYSELNEGTATITNSTISGNIVNNPSGEAKGGGIYQGTAGNATLTLSGSTVSDNQAIGSTEGLGGGILLCVKSLNPGEQLTSEIINSTVSGNSASDKGGGVYAGNVSVYQSLVDTTFRHVTITDNKAPTGGGLYSKLTTAPVVTSTTLHHTIISGNYTSAMQTTPDNIAGEIEEAASSYNLVGPGTADDPTGPGNVPDPTNDPGLGALQDNGGPTFTHALLAGSDAIDAGDPTAFIGDGTTPDEDQRGMLYTRVFNSRLDIGAFEFGASPMITGDFDGDGDVDGFDFLLWQRGFNMNMNGGATREDGDANGDGMVNADDLSVWENQYGTGMAAAINGDINSDGNVDQLDLDLLSQSFGIDDGGDADHDGDTDAFDFLIWERAFSRLNAMVNWVDSEIGLLQFLESENVLVVSTTTDEVDGDSSLNDLSLREAVQLANNATNPTSIVLPEGRYTISRYGTEVGDASYNDLDIIGDVTISGEGPGLTVIEATGVGSATEIGQTRIFSVDGVGNELTVRGVTLTGVEEMQNTTDYFTGGGILAINGATLLVEDSAFVANHVVDRGVGVGISSQGAHTTILRSVFTANNGFGATAVYASPYGSTYQGTGSLTIGDSLFALNDASFSYPNIFTFDTTLTNLGGNLYDDASGGFFDTTPGVGDHLGTPDYVVTTIADTFDHSDNDESLSVREAVDLANPTQASKRSGSPLGILSSPVSATTPRS